MSSLIELIVDEQCQILCHFPGFWTGPEKHMGESRSGERSKGSEHDHRKKMDRSAIASE